MRPAGTESMSEEQPLEIVTRDSMIGTGVVNGLGAMNGAHDLGGQRTASVPWSRSRTEPVFHDEMGAPRLPRPERLHRLPRDVEHRHGHGTRGADAARRVPGDEPHEHWLWGLSISLVERGLLTRDEIEARVAAVRRDGETQPSPAWTPAEGMCASYGPVSRNARWSTGNPFRVDADILRASRWGRRAHAEQPSARPHAPARYARAKRGVIDRDHGVFGSPTRTRPVATRSPSTASVRFTARASCGDRRRRETEFIHIDLWDDYPTPHEARADNPAGSACRRRGPGLPRPLGS
jgi:hypothetical protein